jgi:hypothetical protein
MKEFDLEREIKVVENIIRLLRDCLAISIKHKRKEECRSTIKDIQKCEEELQRLIGIREAKKIEAEDQAREKMKKDEAAV